MTYGRISLSGRADAIDREPKTVNQRRHDFHIRREPEPQKPSGRICPDCNLRRAPSEFRIGSEVFANCRNCWPKHGKKARRVQ